MIHQVLNYFADILITGPTCCCFFSCLVPEPTPPKTSSWIIESIFWFRRSRADGACHFLLSSRDDGDGVDVDVALVFRDLRGESPASPLMDRSLIGEGGVVGSADVNVGGSLCEVLFDTFGQFTSWSDLTRLYNFAETFLVGYFCIFCLGHFSQLVRHYLQSHNL